MTQKLRSPVKWYGGKYYLAEWIIRFFPAHRVYLEPFGGGASVLLNKEPCEVETYNDIDLRIVRLFKVLRENGDEFIKLAQLMPYSQAEFNENRDSYLTDATDVELALSDFVVWRQSFVGRGQSWSYTKGRSRGGIAEVVNGWLSAIDQLPQIIERLRRVQLTCNSAFDLIPRFDNDDALIYCDPPYVHSTRDAGSVSVYHTEMTDEDHRRLAKLLRSVKAKVVVSGYDCALYQELYSGWRVETKLIANNAAGGKDKELMREFLWMNFNA